MDLPNLSIVVQGPVRGRTSEVLSHFREDNPAAQIIFSTFEPFARNATLFLRRGLVDEIVISRDPGALPPMVRTGSNPNQINRMIVSTQAGLKLAHERFVLKTRSDTYLDTRLLWQKFARHNDEQRLLFCSRYTRHPFGINGYLFHLSDWITFGTHERVLDYWTCPLMSEEEARRFDQETPPVKTVAAGRRFRAVFTQEQWLACHFAKKKGYAVPSFFSERTPELINSYLDFLQSECIIADPEGLNLRLDAHRRAFSSWFQRQDCFNEADWLLLMNENECPKRWVYPFRYFCSRAVLVYKFLQSL